MNMKMKRRKMVAVLWLVLAVLLTACGGRKRDAAYYEQMVDSIRKAELVEDIQKKAGMEQTSSKEAWFDSLQLRTLPVRNAGDDLARLGDFAEVPEELNANLGYAQDARLKAVMLPRNHRHEVLMVAEVNDSVLSSIHLCTLSAKRLLKDQLCIYEKKEEKRLDDSGQTYLEYFITSNYEITLMLFFQSAQEEKKPELLNLRRFVIDKEGKFEETVGESE